jgi:hypothetical protein
MSTTPYKCVHKQRMVSVIERTKRIDLDLECETCHFMFCVLDENKNCPCRECIVKAVCSEACSKRKMFFLTEEMSVRRM